MIFNSEGIQDFFFSWEPEIENADDANASFT
jgi:hypothetical protein